MIASSKCNKERDFRTLRLFNEEALILVAIILNGIRFRYNSVYFFNSIRVHARRISIATSCANEAH